ncbi:MAG TPA: acyltransferase [Microthrixaceae bacterium]|nr:acyltransferase [Microthrixaceae bacterium]
MAVEPEVTVDLRRSLDGRAPVPFGYNKSLDGIRGLGIVLVMFGHYVAGLSDWGKTRFFGLSLTIDLFFVLSGYLITALLLEEWSRSSHISMRNFYLRRGLRLLPALYVLLGFVLVLALFTNLLPVTDKLAFAEVGAAALYVYPVVLFAKGEQAFLVHLWTLSVEEWFYFIWPALLLFVGLRPGTSRRLRLVVGSLIALVVMCFLVRLVGRLEGSSRIVYALRPDSLAYGTLLAFAVRKLQDVRSIRLDRILSFIGPIGVVGFLYFDLVAVYERPPGLTEEQFHDVAFQSWNYQLGIWCATLTILHFVLRPQGRAARVMSNRTFVYLGILSYALYLWHQPLFLIANGARVFNADPTVDGHEVLTVPQMWALGIGVGIVSLLVAMASRRFVEVPALRLKRRFEVVHVGDQR